MRKGRFRAKHPETGAWMYFGLKNVPFWVKEEKVQQFIGTEDKSEVPIFEGDILKITSDCGDVILSEVTYGGAEYPAFDLPKYDGYGMNAFSALFHSDNETMEVIGNIFDNPELLEVKE